ncbi:hypothetical protein AVEN_21687-1 [Araneus ventricosus]|uniref:DNA helicase Pif1-like 2B domain-containing protein n=1 Tax=Araneus ventricosus TaxID=182803 RepID=A0A4Y2UIU2_ARAVE|nr:hypothetical protein AVEN_21687-1 [Araneus ventricosus]
MRALGSENEFSKWLLEVGDGLSADTIKLPSVCHPKEQDPVKQLYNDLNFKAVTAEQLKGRAILTVTNDLFIELNNAVLNLITGREGVYDSIDCNLSENPQDQLSYIEEFLNNLTPTGMPPHKMRFKKCAVIKLLRYLMPSKDLYNGTSLIVTKLQRKVIEEEMIGSSSKETFLFPRIPLIPSGNNIPFSCKRKQLSVRLAFSMTINKSQGQTFDEVCFVLTKSVFTHGQLYVGLSIAWSFDSVSVISPTKEESVFYKEYEIYYGFMDCPTDLHAVFKTEKVVAESLEAAKWQEQC